MFVGSVLYITDCLLDPYFILLAVCWVRTFRMFVGSVLYITDCLLDPYFILLAVCWVRTLYY